MTLTFIDPITIKKLSKSELPETLVGKDFHCLCFTPPKDYSLDKRRYFFGERLHILTYIKTVFDNLIDVIRLEESDDAFSNSIKALRNFEIIESKKRNPHLGSCLAGYKCQLLYAVDPAIAIAFKEPDDFYSIIEKQSHYINHYSHLEDPKLLIKWLDAQKTARSIIREVIAELRREIARFFLSSRFISYYGWAHWEPYFFIRDSLFIPFHSIFDPDKDVEKQFSCYALGKDDLFSRYEEFNSIVSEQINWIQDYLFSNSEETAPSIPFEIEFRQLRDNYGASENLYPRLLELLITYPKFQSDLLSFIKKGIIKVHQDHLQWDRPTSSLIYYLQAIRDFKNKRMDWKPISALFIIPINTLYTGKDTSSPRKKHRDEINQCSIWL